MTGNDRPRHRRYRGLWSLCRDRADEHPDRVALDFDGRAWTWADLVTAAETCAGGLARAGIKPGEVVGHMSPNHEEVVVTMLALLRLGAVECPVNAGLRGPQLAHVLNHSGARVLIVAGSVSDRVAEQLQAVPNLELVVTRGPGPIPAGVRTLDYDSLSHNTAPAPPFSDPAPADRMNIIYTSGTTGPAKGAVLPQAFPIEQARIKIEQWHLTADDVMFSALPLYHVNARFSTLGTALVVDGRAAFVSRFSARTFWEQVERAGATEIGVVGAVSTILLNQEPGPGDRDHRVRMMHGAAGIPMDRRREFEDRFGLRLVTGFAMTETGHFATTSPTDPMRYRASGRAVPQYEVAVMDAEDNELPAGEVGELVVRPRRPGVMMTGYHRQPEATLAAFRNLWFHTGDLATIGPDGYIRWVDRVADAIRRRGEMISSTEVERVVVDFPGIAECATVGVPSELGEEEVKIVVVTEPGHSLDPARLRQYFQSTLPDFCVPRYLEVVDELPRGSTHKVDKKQLRYLDAPAVTDLSRDGHQPESS